MTQKLLVKRAPLATSPTSSYKTPQGQGETEKSITILYTNDENGWMLPGDNHSGAAGLMSLWQEQENFVPNGPFLVLSGGDMWTGPAISTWFQGESMAKVMNAMHYRAAAIGNHEFDFKISELKARMQQSNFPFLSANIREKSSGLIPDFIQPFTIVEVNSVAIGLIGLTTTSTPHSTFPANVADYDFLPYETALAEILPQVKAAGAEIIVVLGHICEPEMRRLVSFAAANSIALITGGHCRNLVSEVIEEVGLLKTSAYLEYYGRAVLTFDPEKQAVTDMQIEVLPNQSSQQDPAISTVVNYWQNQMDATLSEVIGYSETGVGRQTPAMENMVMDSWLYAFPNAKVALSNAGGIRQSIPAGDITLETIVGLLPFENQLLQVQMTGADIQQWAGNFIHAGLRGKNPYFFADSTAILDNQSYTVLTTDYLYSRDDRPFQYLDPAPYYTAVHYRQPLIDWLKSLNTRRSDPLENYLDFIDRKELQGFADRLIIRATL